MLVSVNDKHEEENSCWTEKHLQNGLIDTD